MKRPILPVLLLSGLVASVVLNIVLLASLGASGRAAGSGSGGSGSEGTEPTSAPTTTTTTTTTGGGLDLTGSSPCPERGAVVACRARLRRCQRRGVDALVRASGAASTPEAETSGETVDLELQSSVLCDVAKARLKRSWHRRREKIAADVLESLQDSAKQRRDLNKEVKDFASTLGLDGRQRGRLRARYAAARERRIAAISRALGQRPADLEGTLRQVRGLFADEDRIVAALFGADARRQLRAAQLEKRTTLLAIAAAMADKPWDHTTIAW
jgi:hypothetical protein